MVANSIISIILNKYKELCQRYPHAASFSASKKGNSFYLIQKRKDLPAIQIRLSNHGTYLKTWTDREELSNSTRLEDPSTCINISIVFIDNGTDITKDCKTMPNCDNCKITPCIPQTFKGQNELGTPFQVMQYVYDSSKIKSRYLNGLTRAIMMARVKGKYNDPLEKLQRAAHLKVLDSRANLPNPKVAKYERNNNKTNENKTMKKNVIRINEAQFKKIVAESVKKVLRESECRICYSGDKKYDYLSDKLFDYIENWGISEQMAHNETFQNGRNMLRQALKTLEQGFREYNGYDDLSGGDEGGEGFSDYSGGSYY